MDADVSSEQNLRALLVKLQAMNDMHENVHENPDKAKTAWQKARDLAHRAHAKVVDVLNPATVKSKHPVTSADDPHRSRA